MAKVTLNGLIESISGKIDKKSNMVYITRNGKTYAYLRKSDTNGYPMVKKSKTVFVREPSDKQVTQQQRFGQTNKIVNEILHTTHLRAQYEKQWEEHKKSNPNSQITLRGFIYQLQYAKSE